MKKVINGIRIVCLILIFCVAFSLLACSLERGFSTEEECIEAFYQDQTLFEEARNIALQTEWTSENLEKGIVTIWKPQLLDNGIRSVFLRKYKIESVSVWQGKNDDEPRLVSFDMTDTIDGYRYCDIYYSLSGEPKSTDLGEYQEDLGVYYYGPGTTHEYECFTRRLDDHWFIVKYNYFRN